MALALELRTLIMPDRWPTILLFIFIFLKKYLFIVCMCVSFINLSIMVAVEIEVRSLGLKASNLPAEPSGLPSLFP